MIHIVFYVTKFSKPPHLLNFLTSDNRNGAEPINENIKAIIKRVKAQMGLTEVNSTEEFLH